MPNDLLIQPTAAVRTANKAAGEANAAAVQSPLQPEYSPSRSPIPNPSLRLDPGLGLVVIEFRSESGAVTTSIPSERQLQAYRRWEAMRLGPAPVGRTRQAGEPDAGSVTALPETTQA